MSIYFLLLQNIYMLHDYYNIEKAEFFIWYVTYIIVFVFGICLQGMS